MKYGESLAKHPIIIPKNTHLAKLVIRHYHEIYAHQGRGVTMVTVRAAGFWVVNLNSPVSQLLYHYVKCWKLRRPPEIQE